MVEEGQNQPELPLKRVRDEDEDRISRLPDCLLVEILSRLNDTKYAVRTGALSKRWKHIWNSVHNLILLEYGYLSADFVSFVDKTLNQRGQLKLKIFRVRCNYDHQFESQINNWIRYAIDCNVEEFNLFLWNRRFEAEFRLDKCVFINSCFTEFRLDQCIFINSCFTHLTLEGCVCNPIGAISWEKLKSLHISCMTLDEALIENILSGSPVLETLVLKDCYGYTRLNITSKSVKKLVFDGYKVPKDRLLDEFTDVIEINAPNILSLAIKGCWFKRKLSLVNVSSLVEAELNYKPVGYYYYITEAEEELLKGFIVNLCHVKKVIIGSLCFKVFSHLKAKGFIFPSNLKVYDDVISYPLGSDDDSSKASKSIKVEPV